ncbi:MAG: peptide chain release factor 3 [Phenylobacterium sp.]|uniref:peptide chain release factor 3 n=1 Tax=Phenylobacterium sp. TaxID=1871053 RepID=UPI00391BBFA3
MTSQPHSLAAEAPADRSAPHDLLPAAAPAGPASRRTFAIISHPDAGKTTLTEKLLLFGGAIRAAGEVKARGARRRARSDWMKIEQQRGISVTSSVMTFERDGVVFNLLDTPGHEDFSEDTFRTLTAVDSAVMVIDAAKGIEAQTLKLFEVCRLRDIPILTFINKADREGRDPFELLDEIAQTLALDVAPVTWPVGTGSVFRGCYDLRRNRLLLPEPTEPRGHFARGVDVRGLDDPALADHVPENQLAELRETGALALAGYAALDPVAYREGHLTPVFFGSALKDFCVEELLEALGCLAPPPQPRPARPRPVQPSDPKVSGFVFKVQANMDPNHRDRVAFVRLCSGRFRRGMKLRHVRAGKLMSVNNPIFFLAQDREVVDEAFPGDIIGIPNHGALYVGDTLTEGETEAFTGLPNFAPEILRRVRLDDPLKAKQLRKALDDLADEGVAQVFRPLVGSQIMVGVVGQLQLDVLTSRIAAEYAVAAGFEASPHQLVRWLEGDTPAALERFIDAHRTAVALDRDDAPVLLAKSQWDLDYAEKTYPGVRFLKLKERA